MNTNLRAVGIFIIIVLIVGLLIVSFSLKGYEKIERINAYGLYRKEVEECIDLDYDNYVIICENSYLVKNGLEEHTLVESFELELITFEEVKEYINFSDK